MLFHSGDQIGKAGERLVESIVEEELGFVYRRTQHPDVGLDGEIEILTRSRETTGGLLKVQVKATDRSLISGPIRIPFDESHLDYFSSLMVPPILAVVSISDRKVWWKPILHKSNYQGPRGGWGISLDAATDELTHASRLSMQMIGERSNAMIAKYLVDESDQRLCAIEIAQAGSDYDLLEVEAWAETLRNIDRTLSDVRCLLRYERRYTDAISAVALKDRITVQKSWFTDWEAGELVSFLD